MFFFWGGCGFFFCCGGGLSGIKPIARGLSMHWEGGTVEVMMELLFGRRKTQLQGGYFPH